MTSRQRYQSSIRLLLLMLSCIGIAKLCYAEHGSNEVAHTWNHSYFHKRIFRHSKENERGFPCTEDVFNRCRLQKPRRVNVLLADVVQQKQFHHSCAHDLQRRPFSVSIADFGAIGDGKTINTHAFERALLYLESCAYKGGAELYIPAGRWLTGSIKLISHFTLFLESGAVILGSEDMNDYPIVSALPSYGRGRELPGPRFSSLINGDGLEDVAITGNNGTIDGQGAVWWSAFDNKTLNYTRGHLVELIGSRNIWISNLTFQNSPFWTIHPVYCKHVVVKLTTILAPPDSPNTDGIDPDSSQHICIEDCYIRVGDDAVSIKSGWDEYGIAFGMPSKHIQIRRVIADATHGISFGSEMSGGISDVKVEDVVITGGRWGVRIKTSAGRGAYVKNVIASNVLLDSVKTAIAVYGNYGEHPDEKWNQTAFPVIDNIRIKNVIGKNITQAGLLTGLPESTFHGIRLANIVLDVPSAKDPWNCSWVTGSYLFVTPFPCQELTWEGYIV